MESDELVILDVGCEVDGYISDVGRTFPVGGTFTDIQREKMLVSTNAADAIIAAVRPGVTLAELTAIAYENIPDHEEQYMQTPSFFGHHIGMSSGDPALMDIPLEAGMVFTVEPWYYNHDIDIAGRCANNCRCRQRGGCCRKKTTTAQLHGHRTRSRYRNLKDFSCVMQITA